MEAKIDEKKLPRRAVRATKIIKRRAFAARLKCSRLQTTVTEVNARLANRHSAAKRQNLGIVVALHELLIPW